MKRTQSMSFLPSITNLKVRYLPRTYYLRECVSLVVAIFIISQIVLGLRYCKQSLVRPSNSYTANTTLGFGAIYAVSRRHSERQQSLLAAARLTGINITIPMQPVWTEIDIAQLRASENSTLDRGSALAWLGHRHVLKKFLGSSYHTALIMEDDIDWDTRLRTQQIPRVAYAIKRLMNSTSSQYYGDLASWDILWLGHCGDYFNASEGAKITSIKTFEDPAMPNLDNLHPWTRSFMEGIGAVEDHQRLVHSSVNPLCSFAYAVTRRGAEQLAYELMAKEPSRGQDHPCKAYDVRLLEGCRDEGLRCITINPELFHHLNVHSEIAEVMGENRAVNDNDGENVEHEATATNIRCSARSRRWQDLRDSLSDLSIDVDGLVQKSAESLPYCYIDDL